MNVQRYRCTVIQISKATNTQLYNHTNRHIHEYRIFNDTSIHIYTNIRRYKSTNTAVTQETILKYVQTYKHTNTRVYTDTDLHIYEY